MADTPLPDDHEEKWVYKKHTRAKHEVLHYYLKVWTSITSNPDYDLRIFDCFAGRGDYVDSDGADPIQLENISSEASFPGSPVLMLDAVSEHADKFRNADCYFIEPDEGNRECLHDTINDTGYPGNVNPHILNKRFPDDINEVLRESGGRKGFAFFFIDPFNIKFLEYDTISDLAGTDMFDCLITVMTKQLIRWQNSEAHQEGYARFFGLDDWRTQLVEFVPEELTTREAEFYCTRLEESGPNHTLAYMTTDGDTRELKYHLVFTSNAKEGISAMKSSMIHCGGDYTLAYAPQRSEVSHEQQTFVGGKYLSDEERAKAWLLSRFGGEEIEFGDIWHRAATERRYEEKLQKHYRDYLKDLHNDGEVEITERTPPDGPLPDRFEIRFPEVESPE